MTVLYLLLRLQIYQLAGFYFFQLAEFHFLIKHLFV